MPFPHDPVPPAGCDQAAPPVLRSADTDRRGLGTRAFRAVAALAAVLALAACAPRPVAVSMLSKPQPVLESAQHWQIVADDVGSAISAHLQAYTGRKDPVSLYMMRGADSLFADAFLGAVTTRLVQQGHAVAVDPRPDTMAVGIDMLVVPSNPRRRNASTPGTFTALGAGAWVVSELLDRFPWGVTSTAVGLGLDTALARPLETDTEMVLTVSMQREGFYTFRTSAVYYINSRDLWHYRDDSLLLALRDLNDVPSALIGYDLAGKPYLIRR